jgi:hypothetical protein
VTEALLSLLWRLSIVLQWLRARISSRPRFALGQSNHNGAVALLRSAGPHTSCDTAFPIVLQAAVTWSHSSSLFSLGQRSPPTLSSPSAFFAATLRPLTCDAQCDRPRLPGPSSVTSPRPAVADAAIRLIGEVDDGEIQAVCDGASASLLRSPTRLPANLVRPRNRSEQTGAKRSQIFFV